MSRLERREPKHWHNDSGSHRMPDPRTFEGYPRRYWDEDERHYAEHLEEHERLFKIPQPHEGDDETIATLFRVIAAAEKTIEVTRALIRARREQALAALQDENA